MRNEMCNFDDDEFHETSCCGPTMLKHEYDYHNCDSLLCPLHGRIVPSGLQMDKDRMDELHNAIKAQHPVIKDTVLTTIAQGVALSLQMQKQNSPVSLPTVPVVKAK